MTPPTDDKLERLITRSLDGETSEAEELALSKALLRSREARERMDDYRRNDAVASDAMRTALGVGGSVPRIRARPAHVVLLGRWRSLMALAASVLVGIGLALSVVLVRSPDAAESGTEPPLRPVERLELLKRTPTRSHAPLIRAGAPYRPEVPHRRSRKIDREYLILQDGNQADRYYVLERNRMRTWVVPSGGDL